MRNIYDENVKLALLDLFKANDFNAFKSLVEETGFPLLQHFQNDNDPIFISAIHAKKTRFVDYFLQLGFEINFPYSYDGQSALQIAINKGCDQDILYYLINKGADVNQTDGNGWGPLTDAIRLGNLAVIRALVRHGALPKGVRPWTFKNSLDLAFRNGHDDVLEYFRDSDEMKMDLDWNSWSSFTVKKIKGVLQNARQVVNFLDSNPQDVPRYTVLGIPGVIVAITEGFLPKYIDHLIGAEKTPRAKDFLKSRYGLSGFDILHEQKQFGLVLNARLWSGHEQAFEDFIDNMPYEYQNSYKHNIVSVRIKMKLDQNNGQRRPSVKRRRPK